MSTAEVTAYLVGTSMAADHRAELLAGGELVPLTPAGTSEEVLSALERLGAKQFGYWVLRGVNDALDGV
jgi:hypothetical protein